MNTFVILDIMGHVHALIECAALYQQMHAHKPQRKMVEAAYADIWVDLPQTQLINVQGAKRMVSAVLWGHLTSITPYNSYRCPVREFARVLSGKEVVSEDDIYVAERFITEDRIDSLIKDLTDRLDGYMLSSPWRQWDLVDHFHCYALIGGADYRAMMYVQGQRLAPISHEKQLVLDIRNVNAAVQGQLRRIFGKSAAYDMTSRPLIAYGIHQLMPNVSLNVQQAIPLSLLQAYNTGSGPMTFEQVYNMTAAETVEFMVTMTLKIKLDKNKLYSADITDSHDLVVYPKENPKYREIQEIEDLRQSIERGDWVCEQDRRRVSSFNLGGL